MRTLRTQYLVATLLLLSLSLGIMGLWLVGELRSFYMDDIKRTLERQGHLAELLMRDYFASPDLSAIMQSVSEAANLRATLILSDGQVVGETGRDPAQLENHLDRPEVQAALAGGVGVDTRFSRTTGARMLYVAVPSHSRDTPGHIQGVVRLAMDLTEIEETFVRIRLFTLVGGLVALFFGATFSVFAARGVSLPMERMAEVARGLSSGNFQHRASGSGPLEVQELAQAINTMAENLEEQFATVHSTANKLEAVLKSMRDGVLLVGPKGVIELTNNAAEEMLGFQAEHTVGRPQSLLSRYPELYQSLAQVQSDRQAVISRITLGGGGTARQIRMAVLPLESGQILITLQDLTEVYRSLDVRRDFLANVSHELRTPLTSLGLMVENLVNGALDERQVAEDFLRRMQAEITRLTKMVLELLQLSRLESRSEEMTKVYFPVLPLLSEIIDQFADILAKKNLRVTLEGEIAIGFVADRSKLKQVVINLLDNAVKFSPHGETIIIGVMEHRKEVELYVRDNGSGVPPEHLPRVYERFYKASASRGGGTGLGLAIAKHIAEAHGGSVYARSRLGQGATFGIMIPKGPV